LNRRIDGAGLSVGAAYTLARARGDSDSEDSTSTSSLPQDPLHPAAEYGYLDFSRLHVLAVNYIYYLPWFQNRSDLWGYVLGGWQLSGVTRWNTGRRFSVTAGTTTIRGDQSLLRADLVAGQDPNAEPPGGRSE